MGSNPSVTSANLGRVPLRETGPDTERPGSPEATDASEGSRARARVRNRYVIATAAKLCTSHAAAHAGKRPDEDRRELVAHLLETFEPGHAEYDPAWGEAIQRRLAAIADGSATVVRWPASRREITSDKLRNELGEALDVGIAELDR